jgi:hypothetical protein
MYFTTQKQQLKEYRRLVREERIALCQRVFKAVAGCALCCFVVILPTVGGALGWLKD